MKLERCGGLSEKILVNNAQILDVWQLVPHLYKYIWYGEIEDRWSLTGCYRSPSSKRVDK